jgi:pyruvate,water dikinase
MQAAESRLKEKNGPEGMIIVPLEDVSQGDLALAGGKASKLGEIVKIGVPIPPGFVVTTRGYDRFVEGTGISKKISEELGHIDPNRPESEEEVSEKIRALFEATPCPADLEKIILDAYTAFAAKNNVRYCAVRSSATAEDLSDASFAGLQETFLNVATPKDVLVSIKRCWSSLFTPRVIFYRQKKGFSQTELRLAVLVQKMVDSEVSGILFTADPNTGEKRTIIEAGWGLGELVVGGEITPDHYVVDPASSRITVKKVSTQNVKLIRKDGGGSVRVAVPEEMQSSPKLDDVRILRLASLGKVIESHYRRPMDVEWCLEGTTFYIVQARPVTTGLPSTSSSGKGVSNILLRGLGASPGLVSGPVKLITGAKESSKVQPGEVLVTPMTTPDMVPAMTRAAAIVTDEGGMTCHAAIVSRELGVPCVVGTREATKILKDGHMITVDGKIGTVYEGTTPEEKEPVTVKRKSAPAASEGTVVHSHPITTTKVYVNVSIPEKAVEYSQLPVQGVGLFRIEFLFTSFVKTHPLALIKQGRGKELVDKLAEGIETVCAAFNPRPVIIRASDFKTNEYRGMPGGAEFEPVEANPMIGWRGCSRYISPQYREAFLLELEAIEKVRAARGLKNAHLMLPFVRNTEELEIIAGMMKEKGLKRSRDFKLYLMAEVPSVALRAREFAAHCDGFSIGSNDLTQLVLGADRDSEVLGKLGYFDERDPAVKRAIEMIIDGAHEMDRTVGICGQAPSVYPDFTEFLVEKGIDSISLNADTVIPTIRTIASAEQKMLLNKARRG